MQRCNEKEQTLVEGLNKPKKSAEAPALTFKPAAKSTQPLTLPEAVGAPSVLTPALALASSVMVAET